MDAPNDIILTEDQRNAVERARENERRFLQEAGETFVDVHQLKAQLARETLRQQEFEKKKLQYMILSAKKISKDKEEATQREYEKVLQVTGVVPDEGELDPISSLRKTLYKSLIRNDQE